MGVTSIIPHPSPSHPNVIFTGSYDEHFRIFDIRKPATPIFEEILLPGGGVWKLKIKPNNNHQNRGDSSYRLLAACMHAGVTYMDVDSNLNVLKSNVAYKEHESFVYGVDWHSSGNVGASCAFEDNSVHIWRV